MEELKQLLKIRERRQQQAFIEVQQRQQALSDAQHHFGEKKQQYEGYRQWRVEAQENLFRDLNSQAFAPQEMGGYLSRLAGLSAQENAYHAAVDEAAQQAQAVQKTVEQARQIASQRSRQKEKLAEIIKMKC